MYVCTPSLTSGVVFTQVLLRKLAIEMDIIVEKIGERVDMPVSGTPIPSNSYVSVFGVCGYVNCFCVKYV